jgi:hypothetical protein
LASATAPDFPWPREGIVSVGACDERQSYCKSGRGFQLSGTLNGLELRAMSFERS